MFVRVGMIILFQSSMMFIRVFSSLEAYGYDKQKISQLETILCNLCFECANERN